MAPGENALDLLSQVIADARRGGADAADAVLFEGTSLSHANRLGRPEKLERSEAYDLGLRVLIGKRQAIVSSNDRSKEHLKELVARAIAMAKAVPEDPWTGLAEPDQLARDWPDLDMADPVEPSPELLIERATAIEEAARAVPGVTNSEGGEASWRRTEVALAASNGFAGAYVGTGHSISVSVLAGEGTGMERDYDYSSSLHGADLESAATVGRTAGERAVERLNPRKVETKRVPVVFDRRVANSLVSHLGSAINGGAIARKTSFLQDKLGERLFAPGIRIVDDPLRRRGLRSRPFDGEGVAGRALAVVDDGVLRSWILDSATARELNHVTTGHAQRGVSSSPSPGATNLYLEAGKQSPRELIADIAEGFYVTDLIGMGVNTVTGDYSRGAAGFWIENGERTFPVSEVTIAGHLGDIFRTLAPANDLEFRFGVNAPTSRIEGLTIAGR